METEEKNVKSLMDQKTCYDDEGPLIWKTTSPNNVYHYSPYFIYKFKPPPY